MSQYSVHQVEVVSFLLVHFADVQTVLWITLLDTGDNDTIVSPLIIEDALDLPGSLNRVVWVSGSFLKNPIPNLLLQASQEHRVEHQELHLSYP
jgi:hypothetical protein